MRKVVITGLGIVSCLGNNQEEVHQSLLNSKSGISYAKVQEHNRSHVHGKPNIKLSILLIKLWIYGIWFSSNYIAMTIKDSGLEDKEVSNFSWNYNGLVVHQLKM